MGTSRYIVALAICGLCLAEFGCGEKRLPPTERKVVAQAEAFLRSHHLKPEDFDPPQVRYNTNTQHWGVTFWPKSRIIEGDAFVTIDEKTGKVSGMHGLSPLQ